MCILSLSVVKFHPKKMETKTILNFHQTKLLSDQVTTVAIAIIIKPVTQYLTMLGKILTLKCEIALYKRREKYSEYATT